MTRTWRCSYLNACSQKMHGSFSAAFRSAFQARMSNLGFSILKKFSKKKKKKERKNSPVSSLASNVSHVAAECGIYTDYDDVRLGSTPKMKN